MDKWVLIVFTASYCIIFANAQAPTPVPTFQYCPTDETYSYYIAQGKDMCYAWWTCVVNNIQAYTCPATGWCDSENPNLMSITLPTEVTMLTDLVQTQQATVPGCIYVGATFVGGAWTWSDGQPFNAFSASVWAPGEPDMTGSRTCGAWCYNNTNAAMFSVNCTTFGAGYAACEAVATTPSTTTAATTVTTTVTTTTTPKPYTKCCPNAGLLSAWSAWSGCTHTCGGCGTQTAGKECYSTGSGCSPGCTGTVSQNQYCNTLPCVYPNTTCCASFISKVVNKKNVCVPSTTG